MVESQESGTIIGHDTVIKGEMTAESRARILGRFEGTITAKGQVEVADKATCQANVEAKVVQIDGGMHGNVIASEKVQLNASADMRGDVQSAKLVVENGARVDGHFKIGPDVVKTGGAPEGPATDKPQGAGDAGQRLAKGGAGIPKK
jgi:cytoskeletal protein CcmA (bactofilin family)